MRRPDPVELGVAVLAWVPALYVVVLAVKGCQ